MKVNLYVVCCLCCAEHHCHSKAHLDFDLKQVLSSHQADCHCLTLLQEFIMADVGQLPRPQLRHCHSSIWADAEHSSLDIVQSFYRQHQQRVIAVTASELYHGLSLRSYLQQETTAALRASRTKGIWNAASWQSRKHQDKPFVHASELVQRACQLKHRLRTCVAASSNRSSLQYFKAHGLSARQTFQALT